MGNRSACGLFVDRGERLEVKGLSAEENLTIRDLYTNLDMHVRATTMYEFD